MVRHLRKIISKFEENISNNIVNTVPADNPTRPFAVIYENTVMTKCVYVPNTADTDLKYLSL